MMTPPMPGSRNPIEHIVLRNGKTKHRHVAFKHERRDKKRSGNDKGLVLQRDVTHAHSMPHFCTAASINAQFLWTMRYNYPNGVSPEIECLSHLHGFYVAAPVSFCMRRRKRHYAAGLKLGRPVISAAIFQYACRELATTGNCQQLGPDSYRRRRDLVPRLAFTPHTRYEHDVPADAGTDRLFTSSSRTSGPLHNFFISHAGSLTPS